MAKLKSSFIASGTFLMLGVVFIAVSLRSPITGISPLLDAIRAELHLSATQAGMLTTLPLLAFAFFSPIASQLGRRIGLEQSLMVSLVLISLGLIVRSWGNSFGLFVGTMIIGAGIAIANVLLPSLMKSNFPTKIATMTSIYVLMMGAGSALSSALAIPLSELANTLAIKVIPHWAFSLVSLVLFPIIAMLLWLPQLRKHHRPSQVVSGSGCQEKLWRNADAWYVTLFLALNSFLMYVFISWLPTILVAQGYSHHQAGVIHGTLQLFTAVPAVVLIPFMAKIEDKRALSLLLSMMSSIGVLGILLAPAHALVWGMMFGFGAGGGFIIALALMSLRTRHAQQAAALSGMAQFYGYLFAATGPVIMGMIHEYTGSWQQPLWVCVALSLLWSGCSVRASRSQLIGLE